ncbi:MAG: UrcA family protein [Novosphingobium sp.]
MSYLHITMLGAALALVPVTAEATAQGVQVKVSYADLDLSSSDGKAVLDRRLDRAVSMVCGKGSNATVREQAASRRCRRIATAEIAPQRQLAINTKGGVIVASAY